MPIYCYRFLLSPIRTGIHPDDKQPFCFAIMYTFTNNKGVDHIHAFLHTLK